MKWEGSPNCKFCGEVEDVDHMMFRCAIPRFMWCCYRDALGWDSILNSRGELVHKLNLYKEGSHSIWLACFAVGLFGSWEMIGCSMTRWFRMPLTCLIKLSYFFYSGEKNGVSKGEEFFECYKGLTACQYPKDCRSKHLKLKNWRSLCLSVCS
jgi:hypothetical protein